MADAIQANYEQLKEISTKLMQINDDLVPHLNKTAELTNEMGQHWLGEAADKFEYDESSGCWHPFYSLTETLQAASERVDKISQVLREAEEEAGERQKAKIH